MPALRKYDEETRQRAVRLYRAHRQQHPEEPAPTARKRVGELIEVKAATLRGWIDQAEIDSGRRPGVTSADHARIRQLEKENAELRRANEILKTASAFFAAAELDRRLR